MLLEYVLRCLYRICLHNNENFMTKERFDTLMEPLVEQLENELGAGDVAQQRVQELLVPLLAQMAVAAADDNMWKSLHFQLLSGLGRHDLRIRRKASDVSTLLVF